MQILGVRIDNLTKNEIENRVNSFLDSENFHQIVTVNPEFILQAQEDEEFRKVLNNADLNVADGIGINLVSSLKGRKMKHRYPGVDLMEKILEMASNKNLKVFLAASKDGLSDWQQTRDAIAVKYPSLSMDGKNMNSNDNLHELPNTDCQILLCNFGAPGQERFIAGAKNDRIKLAMGVGGGFDFWTGKCKRAPKWMQKIGLEWLWRLVLGPKYRVKRIFRAVIIFPVKVLIQ